MIHRCNIRKILRRNIRLGVMCDREIISGPGLIFGLARVGARSAADPAYRRHESHDLTGELNNPRSNIARHHPPIIIAPKHERATNTMGEADS